MSRPGAAKSKEQAERKAQQAARGCAGITAGGACAMDHGPEGSDAGRRMQGRQANKAGAALRPAVFAGQVWYVSATPPASETGCPGPARHCLSGSRRLATPRSLPARSGDVRAQTAAAAECRHTLSSNCNSQDIRQPVLRRLLDSVTPLGSSRSISGRPLHISSLEQEKPRLLPLHTDFPLLLLQGIVPPSFLPLAGRTLCTVPGISLLALLSRR